MSYYIYISVCILYPATLPFFLEDDIATAKNDEIDIYDEDEEMIQVSDIESEEASEDDIDKFKMYHENSESEYERMMSEIDERDEEDREEIGEENLDEEIIINKPFEGEQMPRTAGDFAPYFKNITEALIFCWVEKHHICMYIGLCQIF